MELHKMWLGSFPSLPFPNHHYLITPLLDNVLTEIPTASLNKPRNYLKPRQRICSGTTGFTYWNERTLFLLEKQIVAKMVKKISDVS
jgi:hypothetical protein